VDWNAEVAAGSEDYELSSRTVSFTFEEHERGQRDARAHISDFLGASFLVGLTFGHNGATKAVAQIIGKFVELGVAVNLDGFLGGVADHVAVMAPSQMVFQFSFGAVVEDPIQVVR
jgi:hypothetical protein